MPEIGASLSALKKNELPNTLKETLLGLSTVDDYYRAFFNLENFTNDRWSHSRVEAINSIGDHLSTNRNLSPQEKSQLYQIFAYAAIDARRLMIQQLGP